MIERLSPQSPVAAAAMARRRDARAGVLHFGPGAFHRAHQAWYFDRLLERDPRWAITGVSLRSTDIHDALAPQSGLYVLAELEQETSFRVIGALTQVMVGAREREAVLDQVAASEVGWISMTVTEKGYCLTAQGDLDAGHPDIRADLASPRAPVSLIGCLAEGLRRRRAAGQGAPAIVSCDNLPDNGHKLKGALTQYAAELDRDLARWIEAEATFPCTMVDSITPATDDALRARVSETLGVADAWPVQRERFTQWVIEDRLPPNGPDLASVGAQITSDVGGYERAKLRLLNGAHSTLAYLGLLRGCETVGDAMRDRELAAFVEAMMREDIAPTVKAPPGLDLSRYIADVLGRFRNPAIRHLLGQIAGDGSKKLPVRLLSVIGELRAAGRPIGRPCLAIAAWMAFVRRQALQKVLIVDPLQAELSAAALANEDAPVPAQVERFLALEAVFPKDLASDPLFLASLARAYGRLLADPRGALSR